MGSLVFANVAQLRADLATRLADVVPATWRIVEDLTAANEQLRPAVYIEFSELTPSAGSQQLPKGQVAGSFDLVVTDPRTADGEAEDKVDEHIVTVLNFLDLASDISWSNAKKHRLDSGPFGWRINCTALINLTVKEQTP
jgi:hypothetical protein